MDLKIISTKDLQQLSNKTKTDLYYILLTIEDELQYKNKKITNTIDFLQNN